MNASESHEFSNFPERPPRNQMHPLLILRDVAIVWAFTFVGGFVIGFVANIRQFEPNQFVIAIALANLLFGTAAFTLIGCLAPPSRWPHLFFVALITWLMSAVNIVLIGSSVEQWLSSSIAVLIMMGIGGAISFLFKRESTDAARPRSAFRDPQRRPDECPMCGAGVTSGASRCVECGEVF